MVGVVWTGMLRSVLYLIEPRVARPKIVSPCSVPPTGPPVLVILRTRTIVVICGSCSVQNRYVMRKLIGSVLYLIESRIGRPKIVSLCSAPPNGPPVLVVISTRTMDILRIHVSIHTLLV